MDVLLLLICAHIGSAARATAAAASSSSPSGAQDPMTGSKRYRSEIRRYLLLADDDDGGSRRGPHRYDRECYERSVGKRTHYPFLSADGIRAIADYVYEAANDSMARNPARTVRKRGSIIYVAQDMAAEFFALVAPRIRVPFVVMSSHGDSPATCPWFKWGVIDLNLYFDGDCSVFRRRALSLPNLIAWFAVNTDIRHPKLRSIPLGFAYQDHPFMQEYATPVPLLELARKAAFGGGVARDDGKRHRVYVSYMKDSISHRPFARQHAAKKIRNVRVQTTKLGFEDHLAVMANSAFTVSPQGLGQDCFRTWEALAVGSVPIVERTGIQDAYTGLPVVVIPPGVDGWAGLTDAALDAAAANLTYDMRGIFLCHWFAAAKRAARKHIRKITRLQCIRDAGPLGFQVQNGGPVDSDIVDGYLRRARELVGLGYPEDGRACMRQALRRHRGCYSGCRGTMTMDMTSRDMAPVWAELAGVDMQVGDWKAAVAHYARAAFLDPSDRDIRAGFRRACRQLRKLSRRHGLRVTGVVGYAQECEDRLEASYEATESELDPRPPAEFSKEEL